MCELCNHITTYQQLRQADPTKTNVLRATFVKDVDRRFNKIKKMIVEAVVTNDCFGLNPKIQANTALPKKAFQFNTNVEKVEKFMSWLNRQIEQELLTVEYRSQLGQASQAPWTNMYISDSYKRGIDRAAYEAKKAKIPGAKTVAERGGIEAVMGTPIHMDRLGMLYTRTFTELKGITAAMDSQISKVLAQGIADGDAPSTIARKLTKTIGGGLDLVTKGKAGIDRLIPAQVRARTLARTEVIRAHHAATIQEYRGFGLAGVKVQAEWSTAGFNVCDECKDLEGRTFTLDEIEGMIPRHPNCRCLALPVLDESKVVTESNSPDPEILWQPMTELQPGKSLSQIGPEFERIGLNGVRVGTVPGAGIDELNEVCNAIGNEILGKLPELKKIAVQEKVSIFLNDGMSFGAAHPNPNAGAFYMPSYSRMKPHIEMLNRGKYTLRPSIVTSFTAKSPMARPWNVSFDMASVTRHEYGHHIHMTVISDKDRAVWNSFYKKQPQFYFDTLVSKYANTNELEAFAESFCAYTSPYYKRGMLPKELEEVLESIIGKRVDL